MLKIRKYVIFFILFFVLRVSFIYFFNHSIFLHFDDFLLCRVLYRAFSTYFFNHFIFLHLDNLLLCRALCRFARYNFLHLDDFLSFYIVMIFYYVAFYVAHLLFTLSIILFFYISMIFYYVAHYIASRDIILYILMIFYYVASRDIIFYILTIFYYVALYVAFFEDNVDISFNDFIVVAFQKIRRYQKSFDFLIVSILFSRLVKEILHENNDIVNKVQTSILTILQKTTESYVMSLLKDE
jgi:hypothetical protein